MHHSRGTGSARPASSPRRRSPVIALAFLLALVGLVYAAPAPDTLPANPDSVDLSGTVALAGPAGHELLPAVRAPFRSGESLKFSVQYGIIKAGTAYLEVPQVRDWQGHNVYQLVARAESNGFFSRFYKVRTRIDSFWDRDGLFSRRYAEDRREGGHHFKSEIQFDIARREARYADGQTYPIPPHVQDALSSFYYTRFQALPIGGSIVFDYHAGKKSVPLQVKVLGRQRIQTPAGTFNCVAIEPILKAGGIFKNSGRLVIWLTDDQRRMPVLMKSKVTVGNISVVLVGIRNGA